MSPEPRTPFDFAEDAATRRDLGLPFDVERETASLAGLGAAELVVGSGAPRRSRRRIRTLHKLLASLAVLVVTAGIAGLATFANFTSTTNSSTSVTTGTVAVTLGSTGAASNRLNVNATGIAPGDTIQRAVDVIKGANTIALAGVTLTTTAAPSSLLDTDTTNGLQLTIDSCPAGWTEGGIAPAYTYTCASPVTVLASRPVIGSNVSLSAMTLTATGASPSTDHLRLTLTLPSTAGNTFQGITDTISFQFTETQRAGTNG